MLALLASFFANVNLSRTLILIISVAMILQFFKVAEVTTEATTAGRSGLYTHCRHFLTFLDGLGACGLSFWPIQS